MATLGAQERGHEDHDAAEGADREAPRRTDRAADPEDRADAGVQRHPGVARRLHHHQHLRPVEIDVPRDVEATFTPQIVPRRWRGSSGWIRSCCRCRPAAWTTGEISAHFAEVYGSSMSRKTVSKITDQVLEKMSAWMNRPLDEGRVLELRIGRDGGCCAQIRSEQMPPEVKRGYFELIRSGLWVKDSSICEPSRLSNKFLASVTKRL